MASPVVPDVPSGSTESNVHLPNTSGGTIETVDSGLFARVVGEQSLVFDDVDLMTVRRQRDEPDPSETFARLATEWKAGAGTIASFEKKFMHGAYQNIIGLGPPAIVPLLRELERRPHYWFHALRAITRQDPVRPEDRGNLQAMSAAWLEWGRRERYI